MSLKRDRNRGLYVGVDGCKGGWLTAAMIDGEVEVRVFASFKELFVAFDGVDAILVDVPIGLIDRGIEGRECDRAARALLGDRHPCVFTPPCRPALEGATWEEACGINESHTKKRLSKQSWAIAPKIREVDRFLRNEPEASNVVREVHPEVLFWALNGRRPMREKKSRVAGRHERLAVLGKYLPHAESIVTAALARRDSVRYQADDVIDALAAAVTASRGHGRLKTMPEQPPRDANGLPMEMVYWEPGPT